jgi:methylenetetrahydrofolate--tRNA-(uracil-5-)-methyltransferase
MTGTAQIVHVVGAGLAGSECAFQLAERGFSVVLHEMRPDIMTPAHKTHKAAELVCSNSFGSQAPTSAPGQLKWEAEKLDSLILKCAQDNAVPAGQALGIDRERFSEQVQAALEAHPRITLSRRCISSVDEIPRPAVIATGPLTQDALADSILQHFDNQFLYFFDAIAPVVDADSIDMSKAWKQSRWDKGEAAYINCPLSQEQYYRFIEEVNQSEKVEPKEFEKNTPFFEGCMPIEEMARRGPETLSFGPMKPVGLTNPHEPEKPYAIVQLRQDNKEATAYNIVGFQTKMKYPEQKRIFKMIPGLENADFLKLGSIHRNMYINSPKVLNKNLSSKKDPRLFFAGQISGVEGYFESTCIGMLVARFVEESLGKTPDPLPRETALGSLLEAITAEERIETFQPTNINFGLFPAIQGRFPKDVKREKILQNARNAFEKWMNHSSEQSASL